MGGEVDYIVKKIINCRNSKCGREIISETNTFFCKNCGSLHLNPKGAKTYNDPSRKNYYDSKTYKKSDKSKEDTYHKYKKQAYDNNKESYYNKNQKDSNFKQKQRESSRSSSKEKKYKSAETKYLNKGKEMGQILGLKGRVTKNDIKKAYKKKIGEYHPDRVDNMGAEIKELALKKTKEINIAYEYFIEKYFSDSP